MTLQCVLYTPILQSCMQKCQWHVPHLTPYLFASTDLDSHLSSFSEYKWNHVYLVQGGELHPQRNLTEKERKHDSDHLLYLIMRCVTFYMIVKKKTKKTRHTKQKSGNSNTSFFSISEGKHIFLALVFSQKSFLERLRSNTHLK